MLWGGGGAWLAAETATMASTRPCKATEPMKPIPFTSDMSTMAIRDVSGNVASGALLLQIWPNPPKGARHGRTLLFFFARQLPDPWKFRLSH